MHPTTYRRLLLLALVAVCALAVLVSCTTPDVACDMRADYTRTTPPYMEGRVTVRWEFNADLPRGVNGSTECFGLPDARFCIVKMKGPPADFNDVCALAKEVHEIHHAMGGTHER